VPASPQTDRVPDDRVLPLTRLVAIVVPPFLLVAFGVLYVGHELAAGLFAWAIKPQLTAMLLGSAYIGGVVFFLSSLALRSFHRFALGFPAVATFASLLLVTTALEFSQFLLDRPAGLVWTVIYIVAPPLVIAAYVLNRRVDPGAGPDDALVPRPVVQALLAGGGAAMVLAVALYLVPTAFVDVWPWKLTELSGRVLAPMLCLPGVVALGIALDRRRSAIRQPMVAQAAALVAMLGAFAIRSADMTGPTVSVVIAWVLIAGSLVGSLALAFLVGEPAPDRQRWTALVLPPDVTAVMQSFFTAEITTINRAGQPLTWPAATYFDEEAGRVVCAVSIAFPVKAYNARRNPKVSLLYSDPTGSGLEAAPTVLVQGTAEVAEVLDYPPDIIGLFANVARNQPDSSKFSGNRIARRVFSWYLFQRIAIRVTPDRVTAWPGGDTASEPFVWEAADGR